MTDRIAENPQLAEIEALLPFYANGRLTKAEMARVETALATDKDLAARLEIIREDMAETILLNESLGAASPRALDRLMAAIDAEPRRSPLVARAKSGIMAWLGGWLASQPPRRLAYAGAAAIAVIAIQGAVLTGLAVRSNQGFQTASAPPVTASERYVLVSFAPDAKASDIAAFFKRYEASVVDGPRANGFFKVRVGDASLTPAQLDGIAARMKTERGIVSFVAPAP